MEYRKDVILILDSVLDDYYLLWECFEEYKQILESEGNFKIRFSEALKEGYENRYFDFFIGENFDGDEELISKFDLTNLAIEELLDYKHNNAKEIRITTSKLGKAFLEKCQCSS